MFIVIIWIFTIMPQQDTILKLNAISPYTVIKNAHPKVTGWPNTGPTQKTTPFQMPKLLFPVTAQTSLQHHQVMAVVCKEMPTTES